MKYLLILLLSVGMVSASETHEDYYKVIGTVMRSMDGKKLAAEKKNDADVRCFVALPCKKLLGRLVRVFCPETGKEARFIPVADIGPNSLHDNYHETGKRPLAESGKSDLYRKAKSKAGIDLSLKLCKELGLKYPYRGQIWWKFEQIELAKK